MCAANPFDTANGCNTNAGFERTRTTRTALCSASATPFDSLCDNFADIATARTTHCTTAETSFTDRCRNEAYPDTLALRESFCTQPANLFIPLCTNTGLSGVSGARTALAELCSRDAASAGCDQFANGVFGATIADCTSDLYNINNGCRNNDSFNTLRTARTILCETSAEYFNPLCYDFPGIDTVKQTYCTAGAGSFDADCALNYPVRSAAARKNFALLCRSTSTPGCDTNIGMGDVTVAQCVANPYRRECYGAEDNRNQDFVDEVAERDVLCTSGNVYSNLCLLNGIEIVAGVEAARVAGCTTPALAAFNKNCTEAAYAGTETARRGYCSTDAERLDAVTRCSPYQASICGADINANPFAAICTGDNSANQMTFCNLPNNPSAQCTDDAIRLCPDDPFNSKAGISGTVNCLMNLTYTNDRAERCAAGTQGTGNCNETNIVTRVCLAKGSRANPFAAFCATAHGVIGDLNASKTTFANACTTASATVYCETADVKTALCSGSGDFLRPFSRVCNGVGTAASARISFCGAGNRVTEDTRCQDDSIIASACRDDPFETACATVAASDVAELRDLRAVHCESLTVADDLCSAEAVTAVCGTGYTGVSGAVVANPLAGLCADGYVTERFNACLGLNSKNTVCDGIEAVADECRENPFDATNPGCELLTAFDDLKKDYCKGPNTWLDSCDELAGEEPEEGDVNEIAAARLDACLEGSSGSTAQCTGLASITMGCEESPFEYGCRGLIVKATLDGYKLAYCSVTATAWEDGCDDLVGTNAVDTARTGACTLEAVVPTNAEAKCNDDISTINLCKDTPLASNFLGCPFLNKFEEFATNYCTAPTTAWHVDCNTRAEADGGNNVVSIARRDACLDNPSVNTAMCPGVRTAYCSDTDNPANAFHARCETAIYAGTTRAEQLQKACAEGGMGASTLCSDNDNQHAKTYCRTIDPYAGIGCEELAGDSMVMTFRTTYCTTNTELPECSTTIADVCADNPFDGRCVDAMDDTTYADARKTRADECRDNTKSGDDCLDRVNACNNRPFGTTATHFPTDGTATACNADTAFAGARTALITKCIEINAVRDDQDCKNAVTDGVSCLANPHTEANCDVATQLGDANNVTKAQDSFCQTTTGRNSFDANCLVSSDYPDEVKKAQVASCFDDVSADGNCPTLITGFCTNTDEGEPFNDLCTGQTGNDFARATLCANGATDGKCATILGASFTAWTGADEADTDADILDAGSAVLGDDPANFITGVLKPDPADGNKLKLYLGDGLSSTPDAITIRLNDDYAGEALLGDAEDGFALARGLFEGGFNRLYVGILHTTDLGAPITNNSGRALWKGLIQVFRLDGSDRSYYNTADFVLRVDFDKERLVFEGNNGLVTLTGGASATISITNGNFNKTTGLITGTVLISSTVDSRTTTGILRGVMGIEGAVGVFASGTRVLGDFGEFVGGFVASSADNKPVCVSLIEDPFGENCSRDEQAVLEAQFEACSTGLLESNTPVNPADCNDLQLSGVICSDSVELGSDADPFAQICSDDAITIFASVVTDTGFSTDLVDLDRDMIIDIDDIRQKVRTHCNVIENLPDAVCVKRQAQLDALSDRCVAANEPTLFAPLCASYREFGDARALLCRNRANKASATYNIYDCNTKDIITHLCAARGAAANPFDTTICGNDGKHAGARQGFAARCAQDIANDPTATGNLNGAVCSGLNDACLIDPFPKGVNDDYICGADYNTVREDRKTFCRGSEAVKYSDGNIFNYECRSAVLDVCGSARTTADPKDAVLFSDKLCTSASYDTRRTAIVTNCGANKVIENTECIFEAASGINIISCIDSPYQVECAADAFDTLRDSAFNACNSDFTGAGCVTAQTSVCGAGIYAKNPFDAFCDKTDTADPTLTIAPEILADGRNKYCQIGTNATSVSGCAEFLNRPTAAALLNSNTLPPSPTVAQNQFLRGTADGLNTGGFVQKNGSFAFVSTLNLGTATYEGAALGGDTADGVAFFAGRRHNVQGDTTTDVNYYAGIHSGTDLGNPLPSQYGTDGGDLEVNWNGRIGWLIYDPEARGGYAFGSATNGIKDFTLTINLTDRTISAYIFHVTSLNRALGFLLNGDYDENGVITNGIAQYGVRGGGVISDILYNGSLIGLIGEQGAVGAFHLTGTGELATQGASGGFVVSSSDSAGSDSAVPAEGSFNHWLANRKDKNNNPIAVLETAEEVNPNAPNAHFIVGGGTSTALGRYSSGNQQSSLVFGTGTGNDQIFELSGLVFGYNDVGGEEKFYTGLLVGTNLGAPIQKTEGSVTWNGRLSLAKQDTQGADKQSYLINKVNFKLNIIFTANGGTFSTPRAIAERITFARSIYDARTADQFVLSGSFNSQGVLSGTTTYYAVDGGLQAPLNGILTGLIGINGVAGVFASNAEGSATVGHYTGGFIASESFGLGGAEHWQANAKKANGTDTLTINSAFSAALADGDYTFIGGGGDTLLLGNEATKSTNLTKDLTFNENLTLRNGDVFSLNNADIPGGISFAQATVGGASQFYAGLLSSTFVGVPLVEQPRVNWRGVLGIITGDTPVLYTTDFTLAVNFSTKSIFSNVVLPLMAGSLSHSIIIEGDFSTEGIIYGTATYQTGGGRNVGELTGLIGVDSAAAVFGGLDTNLGPNHDARRFIGGFLAVPSGTSTLTPNSHIAWEIGINEAVVNGTRFDADVVTPPADSVILDTTFLGGLNNVDRTADGFAAFTITETIAMTESSAMMTIITHHVGILSGTDLGGPVVDTDGIGQWHARMAGLIITDGVAESFNADFTLRVAFSTRTITAGTSPSFVSTDGTEFSLSFPSVRWNENTGVFTGDITLNANVGELTKDGVLRGIIGADGAVATFRVEQAGGSRTFVGGFVAVPESIAARRGQTAYWAEYARNADNTAGLEVRGIRAAKADDAEYTVIEGGLETLELGLAVTKHATLTHDL
ncbi:MAG: hypothetical protein K0U66_10020, partial [Gammaproteobacteria bacterium]|nr:hypothetical protein [Gammaproteobacteria bacterium]